MNILFVCGTFNSEKGKPSGYMQKLYESFRMDFRGTFHIINGGNWEFLTHKALPELLSKTNYNAIWWMPNVSNEEEKFVDNIKKMAPRSVLVISKNNREGKYQYIDLVGRMLAAHANLSLIIEPGEGPFQATILDPLGNAFALKESDPSKVGQALFQRTIQLNSFTRTNSIQVGQAIYPPDSRDLDLFYELIRGYADTFHKLVHGVHQSRFLGNASYRCTKGGFPAFRHEDYVFVSRRNIDKRMIGPEGFVGVKQGTGPIEYFGDAKPSVDTPIQRALFAEFPEVNFMMHSHTYIEGAPYTASRVPCGALEEIEEVKALNSPRINLLGHGCLILAKDVSELENIPFIGRTLPEIV